MTSRSATWSCLFGVKSNEVCGSSRAAEQEVKQALEQRSVEALDDVCQRKGNKCLSLPVSRSPRQRAIHFVAQVGNIELIWVILRRKPRHVNKRNQFGQVPLVIACSVGHPRAVEVLLEAGADPSAFDWCQGMSPIHHSAMSGNAECLETLLGKHSAGGSERPIGDVVYKGFSSREGLLESRNAAGLTPLMIASKRANARAVQVLLNYGACPLAKSEAMWFTGDALGCGSTPMHFAALSGDVQTLWQLIMYLMWACGGQLEDLQPLLFNNNCWTPSFVAKSRGNWKAATLIEAFLEDVDNGVGRNLHNSLKSILQALETGNGEGFEGECIVCLQEKRLLTASPCRHLLCRDCLSEMVIFYPPDLSGEQGDLGKLCALPPCPLCRTNLTGFFTSKGGTLQPNE